MKKFICLFVAILFFVFARSQNTLPTITLEGHKNPVLCVSYGNGRTCVSGSSEGIIKIWGIEMRETYFTFAAHNNGVNTVNVSPDGKMFLSGGFDNLVKLWDISTGNLIRTFLGHTYTIYDVKFSPDGQYAISASADQTIKLWKVSTGKCLKTFEGHTSAVSCVAFNANGTRIVSGSWDKTIREWNISTGKCLKTIENTHSLSITDISYSPTNQNMVLSGSEDGLIKTWNLETASSSAPINANSGGVTSVAYSKDGSKAIASYRNGTIRIWNLQTSESHTLKGHKGSIACISLSRDGKHLLSASEDKKVKDWEIENILKLSSNNIQNDDVAPTKDSSNIQKPDSAVAKNPQKSTKPRYTFGDTTKTPIDEVIENTYSENFDIPTSILDEVSKDSVKIIQETVKKNKEELNNSQKTLQDTMTFLNKNLNAKKDVLSLLEKKLSELLGKKDKKDLDALIKDLIVFVKQLKMDIIWTKSEVYKMKIRLELKEKELKVSESERKIFKVGLIAAGIFAIFLILFLIFLFKKNREKQKYNQELLNQNAIINLQKEEIFTQIEDIKVKNEILTSQKRDITDSIHYALRIQTALLPDLKVLSDLSFESFVLFKPCNIVSGDFYWMKQIKNYVILIAADCTGHGVPGAFMSMLGISYLNELINRSRFDSPAEILNRLREKVKKSLHQEESAVRDGMDIAVCYLDTESLQLQFAGAYNPIYVVRNSELTCQKGDRQPIGIHHIEKDFTNQIIQLQKNDIFYIFSDGYASQLGGADDKKFGSIRFQKLLTTISCKSLAEQREILNFNLEQWKNGFQQTDDILVIGVKV